MSAATGGGMGDKANVVRKLKQSRDKHYFNAVNLMVERDEARAALQELQARNAELERIAAEYRQNHLCRSIAGVKIEFKHCCTTCCAYDEYREGK